MISIRTTADMARAFDGLLEPELRRLLALRHDQLVTDGGDLTDVAFFIVIRPNDTLAAIEAEAGFALTGDDAAFEWVERHGGFLEAPIVTDDDGFAVVLFARDGVDIDPALLAALRAHA